MNDYDQIRTCCQSKELCDSCWKFLVAGSEVLKRILLDCFGFKHILWVFSGRRGIHAWICDEEVQNMNNKLRKAVTDFLNFSISNDKVNMFLKKSSSMNIQNMAK